MSVETIERRGAAYRSTRLLVLLRPKQWAKNLLVFAALIFTGGFTNSAMVVPVLLAFAAMCMASSATYIFNDLADLERDRAHPKKKKRPLASGDVPVPVGIATGVLLVLGSLGIALTLNTTSFVVVLSYLFLQVLYNWRLKRTPLADVYCIAIGFVLRATLGAAAIAVGISGWLLYCTGALALMLGFAKRRNEFVMQGEARASSRESLSAYSRASLDALVVMFACGAAMAYAIYTINGSTAQKYPGIMLTSLFVFYGITRYVFLVFTQDEGGEPADVLFKDPHIIFSVLGFLATAILAVSGVRIPILEH